MHQVFDLFVIEPSCFQDNPYHPVKKKGGGDLFRIIWECYFQNAPQVYKWLVVLCLVL